MKFKRWQKVILIVLLFFMLDGFKAYLIAKHKVRNHPEVELKGMMFLGVWGVTFQYLGGELEPSETFFVAPLLPIITDRKMTK